MWIPLSQISPAARTSACTVCGSNVKEVPAYSTGVEIEWEGIIEVCERCLVEAGQLVGMVPSARYAELEAELTELREWAEVAYAELEARQGTITTIAAALATTAAERDALKAEAEAVLVDAIKDAVL